MRVIKIIALAFLIFEMVASLRDIRRCGYYRGRCLNENDKDRGSHCIAWNDHCTFECASAGVFCRLAKYNYKSPACDMDLNVCPKLLRVVKRYV